MRELLETLDRWTAAGRRAVVARVVHVDGSGPRLPGAAMAVSDAGEVAGSVSGGCVESAVVAEALDLLGAAPAVAARVVSFGVADDDGFSVGLTCGGTIRLLLEPWDAAGPVVAALRVGGALAVATVVDGPPGTVGAQLAVTPEGPVVGGVGGTDLDRVVARDARGELAAGTSATRHYGPCGQAGAADVTVFVESYAPPPRLVVFGAVDFTAALARAAKLLGYHVTVCDARAAFATPARFPMADEVVVDWPHRHLERIGATLTPRDAVCVLTHDPRFDVPALAAAVRLPVGYIGAMGSRRTCAERDARLRAEGVDDARRARIHAPIGLDIGARTPEETAVSVLGEIIAGRSGRAGGALRDGEGAIHAPSPTFVAGPHR